MWTKCKASQTIVCRCKHWCLTVGWVWNTRLCEWSAFILTQCVCVKCHWPWSDWPVEEVKEWVDTLPENPTHTHKVIWRQRSMLTRFWSMLRKYLPRQWCFIHSPGRGQVNKCVDMAKTLWERSQKHQQCRHQIQHPSSLDFFKGCWCCVLKC